MPVWKKGKGVLCDQSDNLAKLAGTCNPPNIYTKLQSELVLMWVSHLGVSSQGHCRSYVTWWWVLSLGTSFSFLCHWLSPFPCWTSKTCLWADCDFSHIASGSGILGHRLHCIVKLNYTCAAAMYGPYVLLQYMAPCTPVAVLNSGIANPHQSSHVFIRTRMTACLSVAYLAGG